jgi:type II secretory pathway component GspD/PulD (secretin)
VSEVPFLSKLPIIGNLFTTKGTTTIGQETLVFVTPYILDDENSAAGAGLSVGTVGAGR